MKKLSNKSKYNIYKIADFILGGSMIFVILLCIGIFMAHIETKSKENYKTIQGTVIFNSIDVVNNIVEGCVVVDIPTYGQCSFNFDDMDITKYPEGTTINLYLYQSTFHLSPPILYNKLINVCSYLIVVVIFVISICCIVKAIYKNDFKKYKLSLQETNDLNNIPGMVYSIIDGGNAPLSSCTEYDNKW